MAKYYYNKYNSIKTAEERWVDKADWGDRSLLYKSFEDLYKGYTFDSATNTYQVTGGRYGGYEAIEQRSIGYIWNYDERRLERYENNDSNRKEGRFNFDCTRHSKDVRYNTKIPATYAQGFLVQSNIQAEDGTYPSNGMHTDGFWYVRGAAVPVNNPPTTPGAFTQPVGTLEIGDSKVITWGASTVSGGSVSKYVLEASVNNGAWTQIGQPTMPSFTYTIPTATSVKFRVKSVSNAGLGSGYRESPLFTVRNNKIPILTLNTENNRTLYEKDTFTINGSALDSDIGDIVNVYYQINTGTVRAIATGISDGMLVEFSRQLMFKGGKLHYNDIAITDVLTEGSAHTLKVWAEDNQGGKSEVATRSFYVVPNRPPILSVDSIDNQSELIDADKVTFSGDVHHPDDNSMIVRYKINNGAFKQIYDGKSGKWSFDVLLLDMKTGENTIVIEAIDSYDFKTSETIKLNKSTNNLTPLEHSVQRYKIIPPAGSAQGVLLWVQRESGQVVDAEISMTTGTEQEQFVPMTLTNTAPVSVDVVEDEFTFQSDSAKENIILKIITNGNKPITLISGVLS